jgi:putative nucleotidyltransferase with HDIG domain
MMSSETLRALERWFHAYAGGFAPRDEGRRKTIDLKSRHCLRVRTEIGDIAESAGMSAKEVRLAEAVGLLHDVGRFAQVERYGTFVDLTSINHARLGVRIIRSEGILEHVDSVERKIILIAVENHNKLELPARLRGRALLHSKLIRDADKLDIFRMLTDLYARRGKPAGESDAVFLELPEEKEPLGEGCTSNDSSGLSPIVSPRGKRAAGNVVSETVYRKVLHGEVVPYSELETLNDFKLLQMGWVFDLNFPFSLRRMRERRFLEKIRESMPPSKRVDEVYDRVRSYLGDRCT